MRKFRIILRTIITSFLLISIITGIAIGLNLPILMLGIFIAPIAMIVYAIKGNILDLSGIKLYGILSLLFVASAIFIVVSPLTAAEISSPNDTSVVTASKNNDREDSNTKTPTDDNKSIINSSDDDSKKSNTTSNVTTDSKSPSSSNDEMFDGYQIIDVNFCSLSGNRVANAAVDIGYGDREYWAFTNEHGQLVKVVAKEIILQDDDTEDVNSSGRYCSDEAKVPGVEASDLDEGHVIADSLGGVSNAYNITPQNSTINRTGEQAKMEKAIRNAGGCTDFTAIITYPNTSTMTPSKYSYTYTLNGKVIKTEFDNKSTSSTFSKSSSSTNKNSSSTSGSKKSSSSTSNKSSSTSSSTSSKTSSSSSNKTSSSSNKTTTSSSSSNNASNTPVGSKVWISATGSKYHNKPNCGRMNPDKARQISLSEAKSRGFEPCKKCF